MKESNPLTQANELITAARAASHGHLTSIKWARSKLERDGFTFPESASVAEVAAMGAAHEAKRRELRSSEQNFNPLSFELDFIEKDIVAAKELLEGALAFLQARHAAFVRANRQSLLDRLANALRPAKAAPEPITREPVRGPFGQDALPPIESDMDVIVRQVGSFPESKSFAGILSMMNALNSRLELPKEKPKQAEPIRTSYVVQPRPQPRAIAS
jgi:hypothetical protein